MWFQNYSYFAKFLKVFILILDLFSTTTDAIFAEFDSKFDSLKLNDTFLTKDITPAPSTTIQSPPLLERISMIKTPPKIPSRNPISFTKGIILFKKIIKIFKETKNEPLKNSTKDGRPIMSTSTTLPDYSALEEVFCTY